MASKDTGFIKDEIRDKIIEITSEMAIKEGAHSVTVTKIIKKLGCTNRVFYNRFSNIGEVLEIVYKNAVYKMHQSLRSEYSIDKNFFEYVMDVATKVLINTYEIKMHFSHYMFEHDSLTQKNCEWWIRQVKYLIEYAANKKIIKELDSEKFAYTVWCFCRGFNADAISRKLSLEEAVETFQYGFGCLLNGIKA
ncbi:MAG: TetR/AcrR family transcriptional regulator [Clostridia bacterium]|nr:TetR/AcrR family transcriptional regulator [Clostridia bacterium]